MQVVLVPVLLFAFRLPGPNPGPAVAIADAGLFPGPEERAAHLGPTGIRPLSKKAAFLADKRIRKRIHVTDADIARAHAATERALHLAVAHLPEGTGAPLPWEQKPAAIGSRVEPVVTLFNLRTRESHPVLRGRTDREFFHALLRDPFTNQATTMDLALLGALSRAATHFKSERIDIVSGYRSPKYNLLLRKKGRQVARESQHCLGHAVDFRVSGVTTPDLYRFVRGLGLGGVGLYPESGFVHCDTGPTRFWRGS